jgi:hypothetical protein
VNKAMLLCLVTAMTASAAVFTGCGSETGDGDGGSGACFDYSGFDGATPEVSLRADVLPILQTSCALAGATCHGDVANTLPGQHYLGENNTVDMSDDQIADVLAANVNAASVKGGSMRVIAPNDPENSFLMAKVDGLCASNLACTGGDCGDPMPQASDPLPADQKDIIRRWIAQGAQDN